VFRRFAPATLILAALALPAHAQVNIDQDKSPAHIYANDCAVCHKSVRGLANGRGNSALSGFLVEHYTSSNQEAAALAAYVLSQGGGVGSPAPAAGEKPDHPKASAEEPKTRETRRPVKPEQEPAANAKPKRAAGERAKPAREERSAAAEPGRVGGERKPESERHEPNAAAARHGVPTPMPKPADAVPPKTESAAIAAQPKPGEADKLGPGPALAAPSAPAPAQPAAASPMARDHIPD